MAREDLAVTPDLSVRSKAISQHPLSALGIVFCERFVVDSKHLEDCWLVR
jgi:hypothetical protein